ncbi:MAG: peptide-methionine (S)-S-oxide reductase MsrA [Planctomycetota bacterium]|jgi:peptide-methionine (S)-S-oxide reductase
MAEDIAAKNQPKVDVAVLGGGCFWCLEAVFSELKGVVRVLPGYAGGNVPNPTYKQVCTGTTSHAEVVKITYDPAIMRFKDLLTIFFHVHDPTTLNRQGPDEGTQYRSVVLHRSEEQKTETEEVMDELQKEGLWGTRFVTEVFPFEVFYEAEETHQEYYRLNPDKPYCQSVITPKVLKLRKLFADRLKEQEEG